MAIPGFIWWLQITYQGNPSISLKQGHLGSYVQLESGPRLTRWFFPPVRMPEPCEPHGAMAPAERTFRALDLGNDGQLDLEELREGFRRGRRGFSAGALGFWAASVEVGGRKGAREGPTPHPMNRKYPTSSPGTQRQRYFERGIFCWDWVSGSQFLGGRLDPQTRRLTSLQREFCGSRYASWIV